jgi:hypothetical protein
VVEVAVVPMEVVKEIKLLVKVLTDLAVAVAEAEAAR